MQKYEKKRKRILLHPRVAKIVQKAGLHPVKSKANKGNGHPADVGSIQAIC